MNTDSEVIARSLDEPRAFSAIFERHVRPVGGYIRRRVGEDAVDDVLSETFLVAFRRRVLSISMSRRLSRGCSVSPRGWSSGTVPPKCGSGGLSKPRPPRLDLGSTRMRRP
ncbi:hypothetical protein CTI14_26810, partial [Methylobacterium radiotolerans]